MMQKKMILGTNYTIGGKTLHKDRDIRNLSYKGENSANFESRIILSSYKSSKIT